MINLSTKVAVVVPVYRDLLIADDYNASLIATRERGGLRYGQHFVSLQREYMKACAQILRKLGR